MKSFNPADLPLAEAHGLLLGAISPRPIAFASTIDAEGRHNLAPFSFFNIFSSRPPILIFSPARSGRTGQAKDTLNNVLAVPEVVINIVSYDIVQQTSLASTAYPSDVSEFEKAGLTGIPSDTIKPLRVQESPAQFECTVREVISLGDHGGAGNLVICEVQRAHLSEDILDADGKVDPFKLDAVGRNGGNWYTRANGDALFEAVKPIRNMGMGVDRIPHDIRNSKVLSGNDLGKLGNVELLPEETDVNEYKLLDLAELFMEFEDDATTLEQRLHERAKALLAEDKVEEAWKALLAFNNG